jgi:hypothetical protein
MSGQSCLLKQQTRDGGSTPQPEVRRKESSPRTHHSNWPQSIARTERLNYSSRIDYPSNTEKIPTNEQVSGSHENLHRKSGSRDFSRDADIPVRIAGIRFGWRSAASTYLASISPRLRSNEQTPNWKVAVSVAVSPLSTFWPPPPRGSVPVHF